MSSQLRGSLHARGGIGRFMPTQRTRGTYGSTSEAAVNLGASHTEDTSMRDAWKGRVTQFFKKRTCAGLLQGAGRVLDMSGSGYKQLSSSALLTLDRIDDSLVAMLGTKFVIGLQAENYGAKGEKTRNFGALPRHGDDEGTVANRQQDAVGHAGACPPSS
jgi:hypothetical protein